MKLKRLKKKLIEENNHINEKIRNISCIGLLITYLTPKFYSSTNI